MVVKFKENGYHFAGEDNKRDIYGVTFKRGARKFSITFGQSLVNSSKIVDTVTGNEFTMNGGCLKGISGEELTHDRMRGEIYNDLTGY